MPTHVPKTERARCVRGMSAAAVSTTVAGALQFVNGYFDESKATTFVVPTVEKRRRDSDGDSNPGVRSWRADEETEIFDVNRRVCRSATVGKNLTITTRPAYLC